LPKTNKYLLLIVVGIIIVVLISCLPKPLVDENFDDLDNWTIINGLWTIENGTLKGNCPTRGTIIYNGDVDGNYTISVKVYMTSTTHPESQIVFNYYDFENYYFAGLGTWGYLAGVGAFSGGTATSVSTYGYTNDYSDIEVNRWYSLEVSVSGNMVSVVVDGEVLVENVNVGSISGPVGLTCIYGSVMFDDFKVQKIA